MSGDDKKPEGPKQRKLDNELDEALKETFPASDPPAITQPEPGREIENNETDKEKGKA